MARDWTHAPPQRLLSIAGWLLCAILAVVALGAGAVLGVGLVERFNALGLAALLVWLGMAALVLRDGTWRAVSAAVAVSRSMAGP